jgi:uncharacterized damage-inducible protein DinB
METTALSKKLLLDGEKILTFFNSLSDEELSKEIYSEGELWKIRDVLAHLVSAEKNFLELFKNIKNAGGGYPPDFDINIFNNSQVNSMKILNKKDLLALYLDYRTQMAKWVAQLNTEDLELKGIHPALGEAKLGDMVKMVYLHNIMHQRDIKKILS